MWLLGLCRARGLRSGGVAKVHTQRCFACATRIEQLEGKAVTNEPCERHNEGALLIDHLRIMTRSVVGHCFGHKSTGSITTLFDAGCR